MKGITDSQVLRKWTRPETPSPSPVSRTGAVESLLSHGLMCGEGITRPDPYTPTVPGVSLYTSGGPGDPRVHNRTEKTSPTPVLLHVMGIFFSSFPVGRVRHGLVNPDIPPVTPGHLSIVLSIIDRNHLVGDPRCVPQLGRHVVDQNRVGIGCSIHLNDGVKWLLPL